MDHEEVNVKAIVLLSGGIDSSVALAVTQRDGFDCHALTFHYGQRHNCEIDAAIRIARSRSVPHKIVRVPALGDLARSSLTSWLNGWEVPKDRPADKIAVDQRPSTYVPARNTVLLGLSLACAETIGADTLVVGFNLHDRVGYPDCTPEFVSAFEATARAASRRPIRVHAPLTDLTKAQIVSLAVDLRIDLRSTHSCYDPIYSDGSACGRCDACVLRREAFAAAAIPDPTKYSR